MSSNDEILVKVDGGSPFGRFSKEAFLEELKSRLAGRVESAWLFGSVAAGNETSWSDIDLLLVTTTDRAYPERFKDFIDVAELAPAMDLLVLTSGEMKKVEDSPPPGFWRSVLNTRRRIV